MDIETFLPLLLLAVAYLYRAFENAAKNKKAAPAEDQAPGKRPRRDPVKDRPVTSVPRHTASDLGGAPAAAPRSVSSPELPEKVLRAREVRRMAGTTAAPSGTLTAPGSLAGTRVLSGSVPPLDGGARREAGEDEYAAAGFDLRDAVIKAAILERREF